MQILVPEARRRMAAMGFPAIFCYDHNQIQASANMEKMGILPSEVLPSAKYSPDMHKPIEHAWGILKPDVQKKLLEPRQQPLTPLAAQELVYNCWRAIDQKGIFRDVCSLPQTWLVISGEEGETKKDAQGVEHTCCGGDWPPRQYR
jgi:hypothetical protein